MGAFLLTRLPPWVEVGAFLLAFLAGSVNAVGLLGFSHQSVSHLTGTSSLLGLALADLALGNALHLLFTLLSFLAGAALSGMLITSTALKLGRHYGFSLLIEAALLIMAMLTLQQGSDLAQKPLAYSAWPEACSCCVLSRRSGWFPFLEARRSRCALQAAPSGSSRLARTRCCNFSMGGHTPSKLRLDYVPA